MFHFYLQTSGRKTINRLTFPVPQQAVAPDIIIIIIIIIITIIII